MITVCFCSNSRKTAISIDKSRKRYYNADKNTDMQHLIEVADMNSTPTFEPRQTAIGGKAVPPKRIFRFAAVILLGLRLTGAELSHTSYVENYQRLFLSVIDFD